MSDDQLQLFLDYLDAAIGEIERKPKTDNIDMVMIVRALELQTLTRVRDKLNDILRHGAPPF